MAIVYCYRCGEVLARGKCTNTNHEPWLAPDDMGHLERSYLNAMKYNSTITPDSYRRMFLDRCVHRSIKAGHNSNNAEYVEQLGPMASRDRVSRMIVILEGLVGMKGAMGGDNKNRKADIEYLKKEYLEESNFRLAEPS